MPEHPEQFGGHERSFERRSGGYTQSNPAPPPPIWIIAAISKTFAEMSPVQRSVVWWTGFTAFAGPLARLVIQDWLKLLPIEHEHESAVGIAAEAGVSFLLMVVGLCVIIPPLGVWIITHVPLPKSWKRREDRRTIEHPG